MTTLVTGATGFVGAAVVRRLLQRGEAVRVLRRGQSDEANIRGLPVEVAIGDLRDPATLAEAVRGCTALFHVAADYRLWARDPQEIYRSNVEGSVNLLRAAADAGVARMVYTSSVAVLGLNADGAPADEETPVSLEQMIGDYKRSKFLAEVEVRRLVEQDKLPVVIVNPSTPIGPGDVKPTPTGRVIVMAASARMHGFVDTGLNYVHVDDVAEGHLLALERGEIGRRYILGGENMALRDFVHQVAAAAGCAPPRLPLRHGMVLPIAHLCELWARTVSGREPFVTVAGVKQARKLMYFSIERARRELGYAPRPVPEAIDDAVAWFAEHGYLPGPAQAAVRRAASP
jgi:dihydroflavonol-4-reductase